MMTTQTQKSNDLQDRWKVIMYQTCTAMRVAKTFMKVSEQFVEEVQREIEAVAEVMCRAFDVLKEVFNIVWNKLRSSLPVYDKSRKVVKKSYPHNYPQIVHNFKYNSKGYTRPTMRCARSRC